MRKLSLISPILALLMPQVYAATATANPCGVAFKRGNSQGTGELTCLSCRTMTDFANFGAANLVNTSLYSRAFITNGYNAVYVTARSARYDIPLSFAALLGRWFSINVDVRGFDSTRTVVSTTVARGHVGGRPWNNENVLNAALKQKSDAIPAEERRAAQEANTRDAGAGVGASGRATNFATNGLSGLYNFRGYFGRLREPIINTYSEGRSSRGSKATSRPIHRVYSD